MNLQKAENICTNHERPIQGTVANKAKDGKLNAVN